MVDFQNKDAPYLSKKIPYVYPLIIANILTFLAFGAHTFMRDKELQLLEPPKEGGEDTLVEKWTMGRGGWHMVFVDLLLATTGLALLNFTTLLTPEKSTYNFLLSTSHPVE
ncbi:MAG: hypothetical protein AAF824_15310 [Bacteroidota bacterium]